MKTKKENKKVLGELGQHGICGQQSEDKQSIFEGVRKVKIKEGGEKKRTESATSYDWQESVAAYCSHCINK